MNRPETASHSQLPTGHAARVLVVIVNYRTPELVVRCLGSLESELRPYPNARVIVVDNPSGDDSPAIIRQALTERGYTFATLLRAPANGGFAYGNNYAIAPALAAEDPPDFIWLLNPDTEVRPGALRALLEFFAAHPRAGITGSSIEEGDGSLWPYAFRFPSFWSELDSGLRLGFVTRLLEKKTVAKKMSDVPERVDWIPGASMMVRREVFETIGLMDEEYFLYYEETDFCLQAARAGFECWYVPASRVMHIAGQSTGVTGKQAVRRRLPEYWFESRTRYFLKNHGRPYAAITDVALALGFSAWRLRRVVQNKPDEDPPSYLTDLLKKSSLRSGALPTNSRVRR